jgi:ferritin-like metal-binding protein YciE
MAESAQEHLLNHLRDVHALELQAIRQLERAARRQDEQTSGIYARHLEQSRGHEEMIRRLVENHGHEPSAVEDKTLRGRAIGIRQLADIALDTPVKLAMNLFALEHLKIAAHELLAQIARAVDDEDAARAAEEILEEERAAAEEVEGTFDRAAELLADAPPEEDLVLAQLRDVHALERQAGELLRMAVDELGQDEGLREAYAAHQQETNRHEQLIAERLESREAKPSAIKDLHFAAATSGLHGLSAESPDAQVKLSMNLYCVEHLEIAAYELLIRLAERDGDTETVEAARQILEEERQAAGRVRECFDHAVQLMLKSDRGYDSVRAAERPEEVSVGDP